MNVAVSSGYDLAVLAPDHGLPHAPMTLALKLRMALGYGLSGLFGAAAARLAFWSFHQHRLALDRTMAASPDIIHAHDWDALPIAARAAAKLHIPFIYDSHENAVDMFPERRLWRLVMPRAIAHLETEGAKRAAAVIAVSAFIADDLEERLDCAAPLVIRNIPATRSTAEKPDRGDAILLHYHGILCSGRGLEMSIQALATLPPRFSLRIVGPWRQSSTRRRIEEQLHAPALAGRVTMTGAVPAHELVPLAAQADIGLILLKPDSAHNRGALPNKFFDYIHAGLMIIASGSEAMRLMIEEFQCGIFLPDPSRESLTAVLTSLSPDRIRDFQRAALRARKALSWDRESRKLSGLYSRLSRKEDHAGTAGS